MGSDGSMPTTGALSGESLLAKNLTAHEAR